MRQSLVVEAADKRAKKRLAKHGPKAKTSFKRNILPTAIGLVATLGVMGALNGQFLMAQWQYRFSRPAVTATSPAIQEQSDVTTSLLTDNTTSPNPELGPQVTIPAIGVMAPVIFEAGITESKIQTALRSGVVHYGGSVAPGKVGNVVLFGHSSGQPWAPGKYKFIFTLLDKLKVGDIIYVDNNGTRYTYQVKSSAVVSPTDIGVLASTDANKLTLITCTPVGTSTNRLVVNAEQISPAPNAVAQLPVEVSSISSRVTPAELPGSAR